MIVAVLNNSIDMRKGWMTFQTDTAWLVLRQASQLSKYQASTPTPPYTRQKQNFFLRSPIINI